VDVLVVDTAHGHSWNVLEIVSDKEPLSRSGPYCRHVATAEATEDLIKADADAVKVWYRDQGLSAPPVWWLVLESRKSLQSGMRGNRCQIRYSHHCGWGQ
jgi:hypothetical protein